MFTSSGLLVRFLKVFERSGYQSVKWVRYLTKANGSYQIVCGFLDFCLTACRFVAGLKLMIVHLQRF